MSDDKISVICTRLLKMFEDGSFPPAAARTVIARLAEDNEIPSAKWSFCNQLIMLLSGTEDARGFRQWQEANRYVSKGAKAIYILVPLIRKINVVVNNDSGEKSEETRIIINGFKLAPVFRYEDTEGAPLPYYDCEPPEMPPLYNVAKHFGMVKYCPIQQSGVLGSCSNSGNITLFSRDVDVFFHELGHQVHNTIKPLNMKQYTEQELVAEMVSCILCEMYGFKGYQWQGWEYMKAYSNNDPVATLKAISSVLNDVEQIITKILKVDIELL